MTTPIWIFKKVDDCLVINLGLDVPGCPATTLSSKLASAESQISSVSRSSSITIKIQIAHAGLLSHRTPAVLQSEGWPPLF